MTISTLCFDLDGTLVSLEARYVGPIIEAVEEILGNISRQEVKNGLGDILSILGQKGFLLIPRTLWKVGRALGMSRIQAFRFLIVAKQKYDRRRFTFYYLDGVEKTLQYALDHFTVVIVTSAFRDELEVAYETLDLLNEVDYVVGFDDVRKPKPDPEGLNHVLDHFELNREEVVFIGDLPSDIIAGKAAGVHTIGFTGEYGEFVGPLLREHEPDYLISDHEELRQLLVEFNKEK